MECDETIRPDHHSFVGGRFVAPPALDPTTVRRSALAESDRQFDGRAVEDLYVALKAAGIPLPEELMARLDPVVVERDAWRKAGV